jgi:uncharacterized OB-fold protein/acyl dehydratase
LLVYDRHGEARRTLEDEELLRALRAFEGQAVAEPVRARDPVNQAMIRHWCDAMGDRNPVYTDPDFAAGSLHGGIVAPPTMLQAWTMRGLQPPEERAERPPGPQARLFQLLDDAGFSSVVATNCTQDYARYLRIGDELRVETWIETVSPEKRTALGAGHFLTQRMRYADQRGEEVASMRFRLLKFRPRGSQAAAAPARRHRPRPAVNGDNRFFWEGVAQRKLLLQRCAECGRLRHPPGPRCPACRSGDWAAVEASGRGRVYSFVVVHHPHVPPFPNPNPVVLVELEEGVRIVSNLVGLPPGEIRAGMPVRAAFEELEEGRLFLQFRPARSAGEADADARETPAAAPAGGGAEVAPGPSRAAGATLRAGDVRAGDALAPLSLAITPTLIVAGAIASRDYQDVHHDRDLARKRGSRDIFMNILTTNGLVGRFASDWAGPEALLRRVDIRLGVPNYPGDTMELCGRVSGVQEGLVRIEVRGRNGLGDHVTGSVDLELPR